MAFRHQRPRGGHPTEDADERHQGRMAALFRRHAVAAEDARLFLRPASIGLILNCLAAIVKGGMLVGESRRGSGRCGRDWQIPGKVRGEAGVRPRRPGEMARTDVVEGLTFWKGVGQKDADFFLEVCMLGDETSMGPRHSPAPGPALCILETHRMRRLTLAASALALDRDGPVSVSAPASCTPTTLSSRGSTRVSSTSRPGRRTTCIATSTASGSTLRRSRPTGRRTVPSTSSATRPRPTSVS